MASVRDTPIRQSLLQGPLHCLIILYVTVGLDIEMPFPVLRQLLQRWHNLFAALLHGMFKYYGIFTQSKIVESQLPAVTRNGALCAVRAVDLARNNGIRHTIAKQQVTRQESNGFLYAVRADML
jgi:hypothetical protein